MNLDLKTLRLAKSLAIAIVITIFMALAAEVFQPIAFTILLAFILDPLVRWFERRGSPRLVGVLFSITLVLTAVVGLTYIVGSQLVSLATKVPVYETNILTKIRDFRPDTNSTFGKLEEVATHVRETLAPTAAEAAPTVKVVNESALLDRLALVIAPFQQIAAFVGIVGLLLFFLLLQSEDVNNRLVRLVGRSQLSVTTRTLHQIGHRLSRYLTSLALFNTAFGLVVGLGLAAIGVPYAALWGILAAVLRFIPYLGPITAMALPILFSIAHFSSWQQPILVLVFFLIIEAAANSVEPLIYGRSMGVSSLGLLVAALFWTWLWGPLGLLLSAPLTVCLTVLGQHIPSLGFLAILLAEEVEVDNDLRWYQRVLSHDQDGAIAVLDDLLPKRKLEVIFDTVLIPALSRAEQDLVKGAIEPSDFDSMIHIVHEWLEDLAARDDLGLSALPGKVDFREGLPKLVGIAANGSADAIVLEMVNVLLSPSGARLEIIEAGESLLKTSDQVAEQSPEVVLISHVPPVGLTRARYVTKRLRSRLPDVSVVIGYWEAEADAGVVGEAFRSVSAYRMVLSTAAARDLIYERLVGAADKRKPALADAAV